MDNINALDMFLTPTLDALGLLMFSNGVDEYEFNPMSLYSNIEFKRRNNHTEINILFKPMKGFKEVNALFGDLLSKPNTTIKVVYVDESLSELHLTAENLIFQYRTICLPAYWGISLIAEDIIITTIDNQLGNDYFVKTK